MTTVLVVKSTGTDFIAPETVTVEISDIALDDELLVVVKATSLLLLAAIGTDVLKSLVAMASLALVAIVTGM